MAEWGVEDYDAGYEAVEWRDGESEEGLAEGWLPLSR